VAKEKRSEARVWSQGWRCSAWRGQARGAAAERETHGGGGRERDGNREREDGGEGFLNSAPLLKSNKVWIILYFLSNRIQSYFLDSKWMSISN
jgi:hypothetical protein